MGTRKRVLYGTINPLGDSPCFCVPIFGTPNKPFYQLIDKSGRIEGFTQAVVPKAEIQEVDDKKTFGVGDLAFHAFYLSNEERYVCTASELSEILRHKVNLFNNSPFLQLEMGEFIGDPSVVRRALATASAIELSGGTRIEVQAKSHLTEHSQEIRRRVSEVRPRSFYPKHWTPRCAAPLRHALDQLMDSFFRECNVIEASEYSDEMYIRVPHNENIGNKLVKSMKNYTQVIRRSNHEYSAEPFLIIGRTGVGKSALLRSLTDRGEVNTNTSESGEERLTVTLNCLNFVSFVEVIREMLAGLAGHCRTSAKIWSFLRREGWGEPLRPSSIVKMRRNQAVGIWRGVLGSLHKKTAESNGHVVPVAFILDNIDRMVGFKQKNELVTFVTSEARRKGYPFIGFTLRVETAHAIERTFVDMSAIGTHEVQPPNIYKVLKRRFDVAFSEKVLKEVGNWSEPVKLKSKLGKVPLEFNDLRKSLERTMRILTTKSPQYPPVIPSMADMNMRDVLTLCRVIIKSADEKGLLLLSKGAAGEHYLIGRLMLEEYESYQEQTSKMRNLFSCSESGSYFARLYTLELLNVLQSSTDDFKAFGDWKSLVLGCGIDRDDFMKSAWSLAVGDFALIDVEGTDDVVPNDRFKSVEYLENLDVGVKINSVGKYYLNRLVFDLAYLACVLQDTTMDYELARSLGSTQTSLKIAFAQTEIFLEFIEKKELEERARWTISDIIRPKVPQLKKRIHRQKRKLLA